MKKTDTHNFILIFYFSEKFLELLTPDKKWLNGFASILINKLSVCHITAPFINTFRHIFR